MKTETAEMKKTDQSRIVVRCECGRGYSIGAKEKNVCPACERDNDGSLLADKVSVMPSQIEARQKVLKRCGELSSVIFGERKVSDKVCMELHDMRWLSDKIGSELREQLWLVWESSRCANHGIVVLALKMISKQNPADLHD